MPSWRSVQDDTLANRGRELGLWPITVLYTVLLPLSAARFGPLTAAQEIILWTGLSPLLCEPIARDIRIDAVGYLSRRFF